MSCRTRQYKNLPELKLRNWNLTTAILASEASVLFFQVIGFNSGVDMVGIATALAIEPNLPNAWKQGQNLSPELKPIRHDIADCCKIKAQAGETFGFVFLPELKLRNWNLTSIATALAIEPNLPNAWKQGQNLSPELKPITWKNKTLAS
jgi:2,4-dienoyl-CoA reductase-like NADH-dependent reductase (Old Yellow Enzyme family)